LNNCATSERGRNIGNASASSAMPSKFRNVLLAHMNQARNSRSNMQRRQYAVHFWLLLKLASRRFLNSQERPESCS
jgi:hypothetical protein